MIYLFDLLRFRAVEHELESLLQPRRLLNTREFTITKRHEEKEELIDARREKQEML